jgi:hypothetical protein
MFKGWRRKIFQTEEKIVESRDPRLETKVDRRKTTNYHNSVKIYT